MTARLACFTRPVQGLLLALLWVYRRAISPLLGPACRFEPSCSAYAHEAIVRFGAWKGSYLALRRLLRCHPFAQAGLDPVPGPEPISRGNAA